MTQDKKAFKTYHVATKGLEDAWKVSPLGYDLVCIYIWLFQVDLLENCDDHADSLLSRNYMTVIFLESHISDTAQYLKKRNTSSD